MVDPLIALLIGIGFLFASALIFWPDSGLLWRLQKRRELTDKVLIEDTLKYIFKCERNQKSATLESLAGVLSTSNTSRKKYRYPDRSGAPSMGTVPGGYNWIWGN